MLCNRIEGSSVTPKISGDTDESMALAIEASYAVVICVSSKYKESVNCRSEAQYCKVSEENIRFKILNLVMMPVIDTNVLSMSCYDSKNRIEARASNNSINMIINLLYIHIVYIVYNSLFSHN